MRIGLLHQYRLGTSGSGVYASRVVERLLRRGHHVSVMSHDERPEGLPALQEPTAPGRCSAHSLRDSLTSVAYPSPDEPTARLFAALSDHELERYVEDRARAVARIARQEGLDVLHANHEVPCAYVARRVRDLVGLPYVVIGHGSTLEYLHGPHPRFRRLTEAGLDGAAAVVALNADVRARLLSVCPTLDDRLVTVPVGVDVATFRPRPPAPWSRSGSGGPQVVAYAGRVSLEKGVHLLVAALPRLVAEAPGVRLLVLGEGVARSFLERAVSRLGAGDLAGAEAEIERAAAAEGSQEWARPVLRHWQRIDRAGYAGAARAAGLTRRVTFTGSLRPEELARRLSRADVLVAPSLVREAFPLVTLEALACGLPPMAPARGGLAAVLEELAGPLDDLGSRLALASDPDELVDALPAQVADLLRHLSEPGRREAARRACRALALRYDWDQVVSRLEDVYRQATVSGWPAAS